jgi:hypothetical protein
LEVTGWAPEADWTMPKTAKSLVPAWNRTTFCRILQPVAHYAYRAIPAHLIWIFTNMNWRSTRMIDFKQLSQCSDANCILRSSHSMCIYSYTYTLHANATNRYRPSSQQLSNLMKQSPFWEAKRPSATHDISRMLWNPKVHYRFYMNPPPTPILSHIDSIRARHPTSLSFILILSSHLRLGN